MTIYKKIYLRSLGVLLYTLVYGTMPFDGSNFKRLVRQISQGEYYEPKKPSSNLIYFQTINLILIKYFFNLYNICIINFQELLH